MTVCGSEVGDEAKMMFENEREFVRNAMENKLRDNIMNLGEKKIQQNSLKKRFAWRVKEVEVRRLKNRLRRRLRGKGDW